MTLFSPDPQQDQVLAHESGAMLVTGYSGSGKTAVLRERFARLVESEPRPDRVALVLGSRRARDQARDLLSTRITTSIPGLKVLTVHGLANHVLTARSDVLGYVQPPEILSAGDQFSLVRELLRDQDPRDWPQYGRMLSMHGFVDEVRQFISRAQKSLLSPEAIEERAEAHGLAGWLELARFLRKYQQVLSDLNAVDFGGMLQQAATAASGEPLLDHVLVDDYQDTTFAAEQLLGGLGAPNLIVAADPLAHVFSFQGTSAVPLGRFVDRFGASTVELRTAHRAPQRLEAEGWLALHSSEEHAAIARELRRLHVEDGVPWGELAVIVRRQEARVAGLLRALADARVPVTVPERGLSLATEPASAPYLLALTWVARADDRDALIERVLTSDLVGLSPAAARGLVRAAVASSDPPHSALRGTTGLSEQEARRAAEVADALAHAEEVAAASVVDVFRVLWQELPSSRALVAAAGRSADAGRDLDTLLAFHAIIEEAGASKDPSVESFVETLESSEHGPGYLTWERPRMDAVHILTAHGAVGREFDTVVVANAVEGNFPSLTRPEPMFDLTVLKGALSQSARNRARLEDERRLFRMVFGRARRRVLLTASEPRAEIPEASGTTRFAGELGVLWWPAPAGPFEDPVSVVEATSSWRRTLADLSATAASRLAALEGLIALGVDPSRWWFQRDWTDTGLPLSADLRVSFSRLSTLQNCELQHVLADELGLGRDAGYQAWVGKTVHEIIEDCENGRIEATVESVTREVDRRWRPDKFPSRAVGEAWLRLVKERMLPNWLHNYAGGASLAVERRFEFELDGALIVGVIDRIAPLEREGTRIIDFKTGNPDYAGKPEDNLQLGIYYLAVQACDDLAEFRPVRAVELAFIRGDWTGKNKPLIWPISPNREEAYQKAVRQALVDLIARKRELNETEVYRPNPRANCHFCEFKTLCPLYSEGTPLFAGAAR